MELVTRYRDIDFELINEHHKGHVEDEALRRKVWEERRGKEIVIEIPPIEGFLITPSDCRGPFYKVLRPFESITGGMIVACCHLAEIGD